MYDPNVAAMARQALNDPDEEARRQAEARAAEDGQAEAEYQAARQRRVNLGEDEDEAFTARKRSLRRISQGWESLTNPSPPSDILD